MKFVTNLHGAGAEKLSATATIVHIFSPNTGCDALRFLVSVSKLKFS